MSAERARSFGARAEAYERHRPGYPDELAELVEAYADRPLRTALEVGAGTGKATRLFARRGRQVTATEPDAAMLAVLRRHVPATVTTVQASLEEVAAEGTYDLVYAAASLHWTDPDGRWERIAALLGPGGVVASFGGPMRLADPALDDAVRAARSAWIDNDDVPSPDGTPPEQELQWPGTELVASPWFEDVRQEVVERRVPLSADDYVAHLGTISAYLVLPEATQEQVFARILDVLPAEVVLDADLVLHLARRTSLDRRRGL